jgi:2,4-dienoyl-CoA reductase-like NADH-dependent reductase (Old Yellow Enzyme family)
MKPQKLSRFRSAATFRARLEALGVALDFDADLESGPDAPLAQPLDTPAGRVRNRFAILPMEGWDATPAGAPSELVRRRWRRFGGSGAALIWGGEAVAVRADGRANPRQLVIDAETAPRLADLRRELVRAHEDAHGTTDGLRVGLQLTHSGRFSRPEGEPRPRTAYRHPQLDPRVGVSSDAALLSDAELDALVEAFVVAGVRAAEAGFDFVDLKHCHGYLLHELLSARERPGDYGGDLAGRMRFLECVVDGLDRRAPGLAFGVRLSAYDFAPFRASRDGTGEPEVAGDYPRAFGGDGTGTGIDLSETHAFLERLPPLGVGMVCVTCGSPYYNPHIQRPAFFPPSDGYGLPEDPLVGVARLLAATAELKRRHPGLLIVGSGYSYLQEWLPLVAQRQLRDGSVDLVGLGRMALSYPDLPADVLAGRPLRRGALCRTFSDCTTAPRHGLVSGCYPLDPFYRESEHAPELARVKTVS